MPGWRARLANWQNRRRISQLGGQIARHAQPEPGSRPVVFFNASARIGGLSQNAAFALLASSGLRLAGIPVVHFVCQAGMSHCIQGTNRQDFHRPPPCQACLRLSHRLYHQAQVRWFGYQPDPALAETLLPLSISELSAFSYPFATGAVDQIPLGALALPSIRWALRRHTLADDADTRYLLREYILSAYNVAQAFARLLDEINPQAAFIFNGIMFPEAAARWVAMQRGLRVITHEVGFQRFSAFFTDGEATAYPIPIPADFELNPEQNARLDAYLERRFQGKFSMAGIQFWPEMRSLDEALLARAAQFEQIVPIFTNVIYDTSQVHANRIFPHMFAWLDQALELIQTHPETLFVIRAHPDEMRPGTAKQSQESVRAWVDQNNVRSLPNVVFIDSQEYLSSYELIQRARFVMVYNSSIGMEATLMGAAVLCAGKARYTQVPMVFLPSSAAEHRSMVETFLSPEEIHIPPEFPRNARRFLYFQLFRASLSFENFLQDSPRKGFVELRRFRWRDLLPEHAPTIGVLTEGLANDLPPKPGIPYTFLQKDPA